VAPCGYSQVAAWRKVSAGIREAVDGEVVDGEAGPVEAVLADGYWGESEYEDLVLLLVVDMVEVRVMGTD
jgi:hypothetical protein